MNNINTKIPISFESVENIDINDTRFIRVKIKMMHLGLNLNNSIFTEEVVNKAIPTLANTPILGYVELDQNGEPDFTDHRQDLEIKDGQIKLVYRCVPFGVIGETNNAHYETEMCEDGIDRTYLVVDGLVWSKINGSEIFTTYGLKKASMELSDDNLSYHFDKEGHCVFDNVSFYGITALGESVTPAMIGANIDTNFAFNEIKSKLEQFTKFMVQSSTTEVDIKNDKEGGIKMAKVEDTAVETPVAENPVVETPELVESTENTVTDENVSTSFSATYKQKREALSNALDSNIVRDANGNIVEETYYYVNDFTDEEVFVEKDYWNASGDYECKYGKFTYTFDADTLTATITSEFVEMIKIWVTKEENDMIEEARLNYENVKTEFEAYKENHSYENTEFAALTQFKEEKEKVEKEEILERYASKIGDKKEFVELKDKFMSYAIDDLNKECVYIRGLYADDSTQVSTSEPNIKFSVEGKEIKETPYGGLFEKYANN